MVSWFSKIAHVVLGAMTHVLFFLIKKEIMQVLPLISHTKKKEFVTFWEPTTLPHI